MFSRGSGAQQAPRVLVIDLNNFARYPTVAVGYLKSALVADQIDVTVLSPLFNDIPGVAREPRETASLNVMRRVNYALAHVPGTVVEKVRGVANSVRTYLGSTHFSKIVDMVVKAQPAEYDLVMVSAYLMYHPVCSEIGKMCQSANVPYIIGGSYFSEAEVAQDWLSTPGLTALISGEVELEIADIVRTAAGGGSLIGIPGVWLPDGTGAARPPLTDLDRVPFPDYADFPWQKYPHRIIPMITGRGCGWGACTFCSDVTSSAGRTYRTRSAQNVLDEASWQSEKHQTNLFTFVDLKLNSDPAVWDALTTQLPGRVASPRWIGSVHVDAQAPNGLDLKSLKHARAAGAVRLTTGLESGSQRILDRWAKGTELEQLSRFFHDASQAGISTRVTMIHGAPGETHEDVESSAKFLEAHRHLIDRVSLNRFQFMIGPTFQKRHDENPARHPTIIVTDRNAQQAIADHRMTNSSSRPYLRATQRLLQEVHEVNKKALPGEAGPFDGVM